MSAGTWVVVASIAAGLIAAIREIRLWRHEQVIRRTGPALSRYLQRMSEQRLLRAWQTADTYRLLAELSQPEWPTYQCMRCGQTGRWLGADTEHICRSEP